MDVQARRGILIIAAIGIASLFALLVVREAFFSNAVYFVMVPGAKLSADGKPAVGWLHRGGKGQLLILTRSVSGKRESYWISRPGERGGWASGCGDWKAPKSPLFVIGDVNPPCLVVTTETPSETPPKRSPVFGPRSVEFYAGDGTRHQSCVVNQALVSYLRSSAANNPASEQRVNQRRDRRHFRQHQHQAEGAERDADRQQPVFLSAAQEAPELHHK